jgi:hypothetical protein
LNDEQRHRAHHERDRGVRCQQLDAKRDPHCGPW